MAAADTILVLDGLQFTKPDTADIYTQDHATNSSVYSEAFFIPTGFKAVRVVYDGAFDPNGGRVHYRTKLIRVTTLASDTITKTANQQDEWLTLTPPAIAESTAFDVSASFESYVCVDVCQSSVTANTTGIHVIVEGRKEDSLDEWVTIKEINCLAYGVATKSDFAAEEAAGQTTLSITNPTTGKLTHLGKLVFLEDTATIAQCEIARVVECGADT